MASEFEFDKTAVVTIQGGGLYGLTLLGQLSAVLQKIDILALAGTSAGAIIAALFWAGWSPRELRDRLGDCARQRQFHSLLGCFEPSESPFDFRAWSSLVRNIASTSAIAFRTGSAHGGFFGRMLNSITFLYNARRMFNEITPHYLNRGCFRGNYLEDFVEVLVREALKRSGCGDYLPDTPLTFLDIRRLSETHPDIYFPPLVLAATNLGTQDVELINSLDPRYDGVTIARAVRASAGFPVFFRPVELPSLEVPSWFIDGGVISNFPAWAFSGQFRQKMHANDRYRALAYRPWVHIGLRLVEKDVKSDLSDQLLPLYDHAQLTQPNVFAQALRRLLVGQARNRLEDLISSTLARSVIIAQPFEESGGPDNLLDLDAMNERRVHNMFASGAAYGTKQLEPLSFRAVSRESVDGILTSLTDRAQRVFDHEGRHRGPRFRSNIFLISKGRLIIAFHSNMVDAETGQEDSDVGMTFESQEQGLTGFCYTFRQPLICNLEDISKYVADAGATLFNMTTQQQNLVQKDRTWLASVPIFDPNDMVSRASSLPKTVAGPDRFATQLGTLADGPVFGVLNLDANLDYGAATLERDPNLHASDPRIAILLDMMYVSALRLGELFGAEFATLTPVRGRP